MLYTWGTITNRKAHCAQNHVNDKAVGVSIHKKLRHIDFSLMTMYNLRKLQDTF